MDSAVATRRQEPLTEKGSVVVTGASGFIGGHLLERLSEDGWRLRALVRKGSPSDVVDRVGAQKMLGDLASEHSLELAVAGVDLVVHLAGVKRATRRSAYREVNAEGCRRLAEAIRRVGSAGPRRVVYLSSYAAGGPVSGTSARRVSEPARPLSRYGESKLLGEEWMRGLESCGLSVLVLRAPLVYGQRDRDLLPYFRLVRRGWAPLPAGPERQLHVVFAADLAFALARAAELGHGSVPSGTYAVADPTIHSWSSIITAMADALDVRARPLRVPEAVFRCAGALAEAGGRLAGRAVAFNRDKAREMVAGAWLHELAGSEALLPAKCVTPLESGMAQTVNWYRSWGWIR